jgi:hypothetical protein
MDDKIVARDSMQRNERHPLQDHFLGWQCRVREYAMRNNDGRPTPGMCPRASLESGIEVAAGLTLLLLPLEPHESIQQFRFWSQKTHDPQERYKKAIEWLSSAFYQHIEDFNGVMTGLFPKESATGDTLLKNGSCTLEFNYQQQSFKLPCSVGEMSKEGEDFDFTYWHNFLFNPYLSPEVRVLSFEPDWSAANAEPSQF